MIDERRDNRDATRREVAATIDTDAKIMALKRRSTGWGAEGYAEAVAEIHLNAKKDALEDANSNVAKKFTYRWDQIEPALLSTATVYEQIQVRGAQDEANRLLSEIDTQRVIANPNEGRTYQDSYRAIVRRMAESYVSDGVIGKDGTPLAIPVWDEENPLENWPKQQMAQVELVRFGLNMAKVEGMALEGNETGAVEEAERLFEAGQMPAAAFTQFTARMAPRVEEEQVSGFASGIQSAHPKNLPEQILATKGLPKDIRGSVIKRLEVENKLRVAADDISRAQADIPHIENAIELSNVMPGAPNEEASYRSAVAATTEINDPETRKAVRELVDERFVDGDKGLSKFADIKLKNEYAAQKTPAARLKFAQEQLPLLGTRLLTPTARGKWGAVFRSLIEADKPSARELVTPTAFKNTVDGALKRLGLTEDTPEAYDVEQLMRRALDMEQERLQDDKGDVKYKMSLTEASNVIGKVAQTLPETQAGRVWGRSDIKVNIRDVLQGKAAPGWVLPPRVVRDVAMSMGLIVDTDTETDVDPDDITPQAVFKWLIEDKWDGPGFPSIHWLDATLDGIVSAELAEAEAEKPIGDRPRRGRVYDGR